MAHSVFQYIKSRLVRWRIFKVYIAPIIEWYLPVIMLKPRHPTAKPNAVESFQHQMLCLVSGACTKVSASALAREMSEMPVKLKADRLCSRLNNFIHRNRGDLCWGKGTPRSNRAQESSARAELPRPPGRGRIRRTLETWSSSERRNTATTRTKSYTRKARTMHSSSTKSPWRPGSKCITITSGESFVIGSWTTKLHIDTLLS